MSTLELVPCDGFGGLHSYTHHDIGEDYNPSPGPKAPRAGPRYAVLWKPAQPFVATLRLDRLERGRSAATFIWVDDVTKAEYPMFGQWLVNAIKQGVMDEGLLEGRWGYAKRGANYSISYLGP